jgi:arylsulfatase A-like enzyme
MASTRREFITGLMTTSTLAAVARRRRPPNIVFILADDLSYRDLGAYGQQHIATPNLDRLYSQSMRFTQAYAGAAECAPSRCSLMTGMHMGHARVRLNASVRGQEYLEDRDVTVAEVLKAAGYATGFVGKWGIGTPGTSGVPYKQGFDTAFGFYDQTTAHGYFPDYLHRNEVKVEYPENFGYDMARTYRHTKDDSAHSYDANGNYIASGVKDPAKVIYSERLFQAEAARFIEQNRNGPFFLYYATQLPHGPVVTPSLRQYRDRPDFPSLRHREWAAMVTQLDESTGKIAALLETLKIDDNTVVFFAGDNGYSAWGYFDRPRHQDDPFFHNKGPWRGGKFESREGGLRVPFFVRWPGHIKPGDTDQICAFWDFLPTAADLAGTKAPATDGLSILPTLTGARPKQQQHDYLYWETSHEQAARAGRYHAFRPHPSRPTEVFDVLADPACTHDLAAADPTLAARFNRIFNEARTESEWYVNPGETKEHVDAKRDKARAAGQMIPSRRANGLP